MEEKHTDQQPAEQVLELSFVPKWARESPAQNPYARFEGESGGRRDDDRRRRDWGGPRPGGPRRPAPGRDGGRRERPSFRDRDRRDRAPQREEPRFHEQRAPVSVSFIPERARLGAVVRELRDSGRAYPLARIAAGFLGHPTYYMVKIEPFAPRANEEPLQLHQCKACGIVFLNADALAEHAIAAHLEEHFTREDVEVEAPTGSFVCVARCRLSGEILGPPNHHGYNEKLLTLHRARYSHMTLDDYRKSIETVRDPELVEKWKQESRRQTVYRAKNEENAPAISRRDAERQFTSLHAAAYPLHLKRAIVSADTAFRFEDQALRAALREAWARESQRPFTLMLALRPAFHHMRLNLFKTRGGASFVSAIKPHPLDPAHAVQPIAEVLAFVRAHPGCTRQQMAEQLRPGVPAESPAVAEVISPLRWLIEKGHVIEFFDGTMATPAAGGPPPASKPHEPR